MAKGATSVWEVRPSAGSDTNGGAYDASISGAGTDYSQQNSAQVAVTDGVTAGSTTVTSATAGFTSAMIGNAVYISGGTGAVTADRYFITAVASATSITVDRSTGLTAGTGVTLNVGGALATWAELESSRGRVASNVGWVKAGTYNLGTGITLSSTGNSLPNAAPDATIGYTTTRGDGGQVTITATAAITMLTYSVANTYVEGFILDGASTATTGVVVNVANSERGAALVNCVVKACATRGISANKSLHMERVLVTAMKAASTDAVLIGDGGCMSHCAVTNNPCSGISFEGATMGIVFELDHTVIANNTGSATYGFRAEDSLSYVTVTNCVFYTNGSDGLRSQSTYDAIAMTNSILYGNGGGGGGGYGVNLKSTTYPTARLSLNYNAFGSNTSGDRHNCQAGTNDVTLTGDPFVSPASAVATLADVWTNFALNNTAGAGAACRAAGYPGYLDLGAVQHQDAGGSGGMLFVPNLEGT